MLSNPDQCPAEVSEIAEAYAMNTLARADAAVFEDHLVTCRRCAAVAENAEHYFRAMKIAAQRLRASTARAVGDS